MALCVEMESHHRLPGFNRALVLLSYRHMARALGVEPNLTALETATPLGVTHVVDNQGVEP